MSTTPPGGQPPDQPPEGSAQWGQRPPEGWTTEGQPPPAQPPHGGPGVPAGQPQWTPPGASRTTNGKAIAALISGIAAFVTCLLPVGIAALILGYMGRREIDESGGAQDGRGLAVAGIVMGWIAVGLMILAVVVIVGLIAMGIAFGPMSGY